VPEEPRDNPSGRAARDADPPTLSYAAPAAGPTGPTRRRTWAIFVLAFFVYLITWRGHLPGFYRVFREAHHHLYVNQADAWLDGHLDVRTLHNMHDVAPYHGELYVPFPPGPAVLLLPLVAIFKLNTPVMFFQIVVGAASVAFMYRALWSCNKRLGINASAVAVEGCTVLYGLGTQVWTYVPWEGHSFLAHVVSLAAMNLALWGAAERKGFRAGLAFAFSISSRQATLGLAPLLLYLLLGRGPDGARPKRSRRLLLTACLMPALSVVLMAWNNYARFGNPLEFGYEYLRLADEHHAERSPYGLMSLHYVPRNAWYFFCQPPKYRPLFPWFHSPRMGMAIWFCTPAFLLLLTRVPRDRWEWYAWAGVGLTLIPSLLYFNTGFYQWGCRFLLDLHPLLILLFLRRIAPVPKWWHVALIALSVVCIFQSVWIKHLRWFWPDKVI
jgi:hypothetical protein